METSKSIEELKIPISKWTSFFIAFIPILLIIFSLFMLGLMLFGRTYDPTSTLSGWRLLMNIPFILMLTLGVYGLYKIKDYTKLTPIFNDADIALKTQIVSSLISTFKLSVFKTDNPQYFKFQYWKYFFSPSLIIIILVDEKGFYVNVTDMGKASTMMMGRLENLTKKIISEIKAKL